MAARLSQLLGKPVIMADDVVGPDAQAKAAALQPGQIMLLENTRFEPGETKNDPALAKAMADMADLYVSDAFGAVHRAHASTAGVAQYLPAVSGFLIQKELEVIGGALANPKRPLVAILGGSKVSSKIGVINNLLEIVDTVIIGGGMAYTFLRRQGRQGRQQSLLEADWVDLAKELMDKAEEKGVKLLLPVDTVVRAGVQERHSVQDGRFRQDPGRLGGPRYRRKDQRAVCGRGQERRHGHLERSHGRVRDAQLRKGTKAVAKALVESVRHHHHRRRRQRGCGAAAGLCRQDDPHLHRRRRVAGVHGGLELPGVACLLDKCCCGCNM